MAIGVHHACGVRTSGGVACWGSDSGDGLTLPPGELFVDVDVHYVFSCGVLVSGEVTCWGSEEPQRCPGFDGATCQGWGNDPIPAGPFTLISIPPGISPYRTAVCAVRDDGRIVCWNDGTPRHRPPTGEFVAIDAGAVSCGVRDGGTAVCWGPAEWLDSVPPGEFTAVSGSPSHACGLRPGGAAECWGTNTRGAATPPPGRFTAIDVEGTLSCGLRPNGDKECWGAATEYQPAPFNTTAADFDDTYWRDSYPGGTFTTISASGDYYGCGLRPDNTVECWSPRWPPGTGVADPATPLGGSTTVAEPQTRGVREELQWVQGDLPGGPYTTLSSGWFDTCAIRTDSTVDCWGETTGSPDGQFTTIDVHWFIACGIRPSGETHCWALDTGEPGEMLDLPVLAETGQVVALDSGLGALCGLLDDGSITCWNFGAELVAIPGPFEQFSIGAGDVWELWAHDPSEENTHTCAIHDDGSIECWGTNGSGQTELPPPWLDAPPYSDIAAGFAHTCALGATGEAVCWGDDRHGQTRAPTGTFTALSAGQWHTCGLRPDGEITCWGNGPSRHDGPPYDAPPHGAPAEPPPGPFTAIAAGQWHTCALRTDGTATCWLSY